jgi:ubiquinone/menaquinone biosynthesis C-methylase UbiE
MENPYFDTRFKYSKNRDYIWKVLCKYLQQFIPEGAKVLDAGAGYCYFINNIEVGEKYALDSDREVLNYADDNVNKIVGNAESTRFEDGFFDVIFSSNLLEHLSTNEILNTLNEFNRIIKEGGRVIIISPNFKYCFRVYFDDFTHKSMITDNSLKDMLHANRFKVEKIMPRFLPFSTESKLPKSDFLLRIYLMSPWKPFAGQMLAVARKPRKEEALD